MFNFSSVLQELYPGDFYSIFRNIFSSQEGQIPPRDLLLRVLQYILICRNAKGLNMNGMFANVLKINDIAMATITGTSPLRIIYAAKSFFREKNFSGMLRKYRFQVTCSILVKSWRTMLGSIVARWRFHLAKSDTRRRVGEAAFEISAFEWATQNSEVKFREGEKSIPKPLNKDKSPGIKQFMSLQKIVFDIGFPLIELI